MSLKDYIFRLAVALIFIFLYLPSVVIILYSFSITKGLFGFPPLGFTLKWYEDMFRDQTVVTALVNSIVIAVVSSALSVGLGFMLAFALTRYRVRFKPIIESLVYLPMLIPPLIIGISMLLFISRVLTLKTGFWSIVVGHTLLALPLSTLILNAGMSRIDKTLEWAAMDLGADNIKTLRYVTLPLVYPSILSAFLISFIISFDEFIVTYFLAPPGFQTLPLWIWSQLRFGITNVLNAIASVVIYIGITAAVVSQMLRSRYR